MTKHTRQSSFLRAPSGVVALAAASILLLAGCATATPAAPGSSASETPEPAPSPTVTDSWSSAQPGEPTLALYSDGTLGGFDGCNAFGGTYTRDGDAITFEFGYGTLKACIGVDTWLRNAGSAEIVDDTLRVFDLEGDPLGILDATR